jgi:hypothetical protein
LVLVVVVEKVLVVVVVELVVMVVVLIAGAPQLLLRRDGISTRLRVGAACARGVKQLPSMGRSRSE